MDIFTLQYAQSLDEQYNQINEFNLPPGTFETGQGIYFLGHSLGLMHQKSQDEFDRILQSWQEYSPLNDNSKLYEEEIKQLLSQIIGCQSEEVALSGTLTQCMHIMFERFYHPKGNKTKILIDAPSFPSDIYAMKAQIKNKGLDEKENLIVLYPKEGQNELCEQDILDVIYKERDNLLIIFMQALNYLTGQLFNIEKITKYAQQFGVIVGWDLAHAIGNVPLYLDKWNIDFATYCTYKFLDAGPHTSGGLFINKKHLVDHYQLKGWYGHDGSFEGQFNPKNSADRFNLSPPSDILMSFWIQPFRLVAKIGIEKIRERSILLTNFLEKCLDHINENEKYFKIITPRDPQQRGATLTLYFKIDADKLTTKLRQMQIFTDFRKPNCMRICPAPLYNTFTNVFILVREFQTLLELIS